MPAANISLHDMRCRGQRPAGQPETDLQQPAQLSGSPHSRQPSGVPREVRDVPAPASRGHTSSDPPVRNPELHGPIRFLHHSEQHGHGGVDGDASPQRFIDRLAYRLAGVDPDHQPANFRQAYPTNMVAVGGVAVDMGSAAARDRRLAERNMHVQRAQHANTALHTVHRPSRAVVANQQTNRRLELYAPHAPQGQDVPPPTIDTQAPMSQQPSAEQQRARPRPHQPPQQSPSQLPPPPPQQQQQQGSQQQGSQQQEAQPQLQEHSRPQPVPEPPAPARPSPQPPFAPPLSPQPTHLQRHVPTQPQQQQQQPQQPQQARPQPQAQAQEHVHQPVQLPLVPARPQPHASSPSSPSSPASPPPQLQHQAPLQQQQQQHQQQPESHPFAGGVLRNALRPVQVILQSPQAGTDARLLNQLPTHTLTEAQLSAGVQAGRSWARRGCTICLEDFKAGDKQKTLPCFHQFHQECVDLWLGRSGTCPTCKLPVDTAQNP